MGIFTEPVGFVVRNRLCERLARDRHAITVVRAPAGFGKTALLQQYERDHLSGQRVAWVNVEHSEPGGSPELPAALAQAPCPQVVIVDVGDRAVEGELMTELFQLANARPAPSVIVIGREIETWRAHEKLVRTNQIGASDLLLTRQEVVDVAVACRAQQPDRVGAQLFEAVAGWPWLTQLLAKSAAATPNLLAAGQVIRHDIVQFVHQGFGLSANAQDFAHRFALSHPRLPAVHSLYSEDPQGARAELRARGLVYGGGPVGGALRMPPMLREVWACQFAHVDPHGARAMHAKLADFALEHEEVEIAIHHASLGEDWQRATELVERYWPQVVGARSALVTRALRRIPRRLLLANPQGSVVVSGLLGFAASANKGRGEAEALRHESAARDEGDLSAMDDLAADSMTDYLEGRPAGRRAELDAALDESVAALVTGDPEVEVVVGRLAAIRGYLSLNAGDATAALDDFNTILALFEGESTIRCALGQWLTILATSIDGDLLQVQSAIARYESPAFRRVGVGGVGLVLQSTVEAYCAIDQGDAQEALGIIEAPGLLGSAYHIVTIDLLYIRSRCEPLVEGSGAFALVELERTIEFLQVRNPDVLTAVPKLAAALVELRISRGEHEQAAELLRSLPDSHLLRLAQARLLLRTGDLVGAAAQATSVTDDPIATKRSRQEALLINACAAAALGRDADAVRHLNEAARSSIYTGSSFAFRAVSVEHLADLPGVGQQAMSLMMANRAGPSGDPEVVVVPVLTRREAEVLESLERGATIREIAESHYLSQNTIKSQVRSLYRKLQASDRDGALARARECGLLGPRGGDHSNGDDHRDRETENR